MEHKTAITDETGVVQNVIMAEHSTVNVEDLDLPLDWQAIPGDAANIGDTWNGAQFVPPLPLTTESSVAEEETPE